MAFSHNLDHGACLLCESKLKDGHQFFRDLWPKLKAKFPIIHISCVFRNAEEQEYVFKLGASRKRWPNSKHNLMLDGKPCARAIDLFSIGEDGVAVFSPYQYLQVAKWCKENDLPIVWGGSWLKFRDQPHFEMTDDFT